MLRGCCRTRGSGAMPRHSSPTPSSGCPASPALPWGTPFPASPARPACPACLPACPCIPAGTLPACRLVALTLLPATHPAPRLPRRGAERAAAIERWAGHVAAAEGRPWTAVGLLVAAGALKSALQLLRQVSGHAVCGALRTVLKPSCTCVPTPPPLLTISPAAYPALPPPACSAGCLMPPWRWWGPARRQTCPCSSTTSRLGSSPTCGRGASQPSSASTRVRGGQPGLGQPAGGDLRGTCPDAATI